MGALKLAERVGETLREAVRRAGPRISGPTLRIGMMPWPTSVLPIDPVALLARAAAAVRTGRPEPEYPWVSRFADASTVSAPRRCSRAHHRAPVCARREDEGLMKAAISCSR